MWDGTLNPVEICRYKSNLYDEPIVFASDLHKDCAAVVEFLLLFLEPWEWTFVSLGDMAGTGEFGSNADPTDEYKRIHRSFRKFYFVDGNHDRPRERAHLLTNADGTKCCLQGSAGKLGSATARGVSGIMSGLNSPGKLSKPVFEERISEALETGDVHTFLTHDAPRTKGFSPEVGNPLLAQHVELHQPRVHVFGHRHLQPAVVGGGPTIFINTDRRVVMMEPG